MTVGVAIIVNPKNSSTPTHKKLMMAKRVQNNYDEDDDDGRPRKIPKTLKEKDSQKRLVLVLERANLETIKVIV